jgi:hypothetical protein
MAETLALLTGAALLVLLLVVGIGAYVITERLKGAHQAIQRIHWGVRAIEVETGHLTAQAPTLIEGFAQLDGGAKVIAQRLASAEQRLAAVARAMGVKEG